MSQLCALWDVVSDLTGQQVYLWTCAEVLTPPEVEIASMVVTLKAAPPGKYPHRLAVDWCSLGFDAREAKRWIRAGVRDPEDASRQKARGCGVTQHAATGRFMVTHQ